MKCGQHWPSAQTETRRIAGMGWRDVGGREVRQRGGAADHAGGGCEPRGKGSADSSLFFGPPSSANGKRQVLPRHGRLHPHIAREIRSSAISVRYAFTGNVSAYNLTC